MTNSPLTASTIRTAQTNLRLTPLRQLAGRSLAAVLGRRIPDSSGSEVYNRLGPAYFEPMSTADLIYEKAKALPGTLQTEALHYVDFLLSRQEAKSEDGDWARFSASQLEKQYAPADAIYDTDCAMATSWIAAPLGRPG